MASEYKTTTPPRPEPGEAPSGPLPQMRKWLTREFRAITERLRSTPRAVVLTATLEHNTATKVAHPLGEVPHAVIVSVLGGIASPFVLEKTASTVTVQIFTTPINQSRDCDITVIL